MSHSYVEFSIKYMGAAKVRGRFADFSGIIFYDEKSLASTSVSVMIKTASINTDLEFRDNDLRSANWFDAAKYPGILFQSRSAVRTATGFDLTGDITIKGITKEIVLHMEHPSPVMKDVRADIQVVFTGTTRLDRTIFGVEGKNWSAVKEGITAVDNEVTIEVSMLGKQAQRANYTNRFKDPEQPTGKMYKVIQEQGVDTGITEFDKMKATATVDAGTLDTVGKMLRLEGKITEAMKVFEHNRQLFPDSPLVYMSLGETYIIMGNVALAREQFTQVLVKDPLNVISREYLRHLE
jgi:polyisoprenoid-binding protein YceI